MAPSLLDDAEQHPELFNLERPAVSSEIAHVEAVLEIELPPSFTAVLRRHGQGLLFDNESLLGVHEPDDGLGDLLSVNRELHDCQGLPAHLVVFHLGTGGLHAFDSSSPDAEHTVVELDEDSLRPVREFDDFDAWYVQCLRVAYADLLDLGTEI